MFKTAEPMALLQPWKHSRRIPHLRNGFKLTTTSFKIPNRNSSSICSPDDIPDFGHYSVILPPEPYVFGVSDIKPRPVPSYIRRPSYVDRSTEGTLGTSEIRVGRCALGGESEVRIREAAKLAKKVREYAGSLVQVCIIKRTANNVLFVEESERPV